MPKKPYPLLTPDTSNRDIMNAIRNYASDSYRRYVPPATQAKMSDTINNLLDNMPGRNEFMDVLVNKIAATEIRHRNWTNKLGKFKGPMIRFGNSIEEVQIGLAQAYTYDADRDYLERMVFGQHRVEAQANIHKVNREEFFPVTVNEDMLRRALHEEGGLVNLVDGIIAAAYNRDELNEFVSMCQLIKEYDKADGFYRVNVPDVAANASTADDAKVLLRRIRAYADNLQFISRNYNAAGMPVFANPDQLELIISPEVNAAIDVEALAAAFNIDRAQVPMRTTVIPAEHFPEGVQAILTTDDFFVVRDTLYETRNADNPVGLTRNYFLHHHQIISASRFVPAIAFTTGPGTEIVEVDTPVTGMTAITIEDRDGDAVTSVERGIRYQVLGSAITTPAGGINDAIRLDLVGAQSTYSHVTQTGVLVVSPMDEAETVKIVATSVDDREFYAELDVPVTGDILRLWPDPDVVTPEEDPGEEGTGE